MSHDPAKLRAAIFANSVETKDWTTAAHEWNYVKSVHGGWTECVCGMRIMERCYIANPSTRAELIVGNVCIKNFMSDNIQLVADMRAAIFERDRRPCGTCGKLTRHPEICGRCALAETRAEVKRRAAAAADAEDERRALALIAAVKNARIAREQARAKAAEAAVEAKWQAELDVAMAKAKQRALAQMEHARAVQREREQARVEAAAKAERVAAYQARLDEDTARRTLATERALAIELAQLQKWDRLKSVLDVDKLNDTERAFVCKSVYLCIMHDTKLSDKQRDWLRRLCKRHPRRGQ